MIINYLGGFQAKLLNLKTGSMSIENNDYIFTDLRHSFGLSFYENGKLYAIMADSDFHDDLVAAITGAELAVFDSGHITDEEIVQLATRSQAKKLVCSHQYRELDEALLNKAASKQGYKGTIIVAKDLMEFGVCMGDRVE